MLERVATSAAAAAVCLVLQLPPAVAAEPVETAIRDWVASIDASPDWSAGFSALRYDAASRRATLDGLSIRSETPGIEIDFGSISVTGFIASPDGGFTAARIALDNGSLSMGPFKVTLSDAEINEFAMPAVAGVAWDAERPFTSLLKAYAPFSRIAMTNGRIGSLTLVEDNDGVLSRVAYDQFRIDRWVDGRIAAVTAGPLSMEAPDPDGLVTMDVASFEARDIDIDAVLRVLDPDRYVGGIGDEVWHRVTRLAAYHDFSVAGPGFKATMSLVSAEDFRLRQPRKSFAPLLDRLMVDSDIAEDDSEAAEAVINLVSAYGLGRLGISQIDIEATGIDGIHLGGFNISDLAIDRLGEFAIDDFAAAVADQGSIRIGRFAFGDVAFPGVDVLLRAVRAEAVGDEVDANGLLPKLGFLELSAVDFAAAGVPRMTLNRMRVDLSGYIGPVPTSISADLQGLVAPVSLLEPDAKAVFERLGYEQIDVSYRVKVNWHESDETVSLDDLHIGVKGAGGLGLSMVLDGLPREAIENPEALPDVIPGLSLRMATLTLKDDSIVGKGLDLLAEKMRAPPEKFRQQFADAMPLMLSLFVLNDPHLAALVRQSGLLAKLAPVVKAFIAAPGSSITVSLAPPTPVALPAIAEAAEEQPETLIDMLGLSVAGSAILPAPESTVGAAAPSKPGNPGDGAIRPTSPPQ